MIQRLFPFSIVKRAYFDLMLLTALASVVGMLMKEDLLLDICYMPLIMGSLFLNPASQPSFVRTRLFFSAVGLMAAVRGFWKVDIDRHAVGLSHVICLASLVWEVRITGAGLAITFFDKEPNGA